MRPERFSELVEDLTLACRDVLKARGQAPALRSVE